MIPCRLCGGSGLASILELGPQPVCSRYVGPGGAPEFLHPMNLGACAECGVLQILGPVPADKMRPIYSWITYKEPEAHLDKLADLLRGLPGVDENTVAAGISFKDDPLLDRLRTRGVKQTWRLDAQSDLASDVAGAGVETVQGLITPSAGKKIASLRGKVGILLARHILEHAHDLQTFIAGLRELVAPGGYLMLELPDSRRCMEVLDYSLLWEEHLLYFSEETFRGAFRPLGLSLHRLERYPYALEDVFVGIARFADGPAPRTAARDGVTRDRDLALQFAKRLGPARDAIRRHLEPMGDVAVFGGGHRACVFINLMGLKDRVAFVVDDDANKKGMRMPGSGLPILPSAALIEKNIKTCLLTVSPESEERVIQRQEAFTKAGGRFVSIYPDSRHGLPIESLLAGGRA